MLPLHILTFRDCRCPPSLPPSCSYAMTLNLDLLSLFCPEHKGPLFFLLDGVQHSPCLTPIMSAVSSNKYVARGDRRACPPADFLGPGITLYNYMHNGSSAVSNTNELVVEDEGTSRMKHTTFLKGEILELRNRIMIRFGAVGTS